MEREAKEALANADVLEVETAPGAGLRVRTRWRYADGSSVDVFVPAMVTAAAWLTDMGQTLAMVANTDDGAGLTAEQERRARGALGHRGVEMVGTELRVPLMERGDLSAGITRLGTACVTVAEWLTGGRRGAP